MKRLLRIAGTVAVIIVALLGLTLIAAEPVLNSIAVKSQIENIVGETLDMSFKIEGRIKLRFLLFLSVVVNKISISISQGKIASADRIEIDPRLPKLLFLKVHLEDVHIHNPQLTFDSRALDKVLALAGEGSDEPLPVTSLVIDSFSISKAKFFYSDTQSVVDLNEMNIDGGPMAIIEDRKVIIDDVTSFFRAFNFKGEMSAQQIVSQDFKLTNIKAQVQDENGILTFDPIELEYLGSSTKLAGKLDLSRKMPTAQLRLKTSASDIKRLAARIFPDVEFRGAMKGPRGRILNIKYSRPIFII